MAERRRRVEDMTTAVELLIKHQKTSNKKYTQEEARRLGSASSDSYTPAHFRGTNMVPSIVSVSPQRIATIFRDKTAGAVLRARGELFVYPGERGPTGNKFGPLPSSHEAAVQNN